MNIWTILQLIITFLSLLSSILAWIAKIRWSKEYSLAKDEIIRSKEAQIELLENTIQKYKDFSPEIVMRLFETTKKASDEYIEISTQELTAAQKEIDKLKNEREINSTQQEQKIALLTKERDNLSKELAIIQANPYAINAGTIISASGSSIAISNTLNRGTVEDIKHVTIPFIDEYSKEEFERKFPTVTITDLKGTWSKLKKD